MNYPGVRVTEDYPAQNEFSGQYSVSLENGLHVASLAFDSGGQPTTSGTSFWVEQLPAENRPATYFDFTVATSGSEADQLFNQHRSLCSLSAGGTDASCGAIYELASDVSIATVKDNFTQRCEAYTCNDWLGVVTQDEITLGVIEELVTLGTLKAYMVARGTYAGFRAASAAGHAANSLDEVVSGVARANVPTIHTPYQVHIDPHSGVGPMAIDTAGYKGPTTLNGGVRNRTEK